MAQFPSLKDSDTRSLARHPFRALRAMQNQMDRWFDQIMEPGFSDFESDLSSSAGAGFTPTCDIEESDQEYMLNFDLPGVKKEDIKVNLRDNVLTVSGERNESHDEKKKKGAYRSERFFGSFQRSFTLPSSIKADQVEANYADGVLSLRIPKPEEAKAQEIRVGDKNMALTSDASSGASSSNSSSGASSASNKSSSGKNSGMTLGPTRGNAGDVSSGNVNVGSSQKH